MVKHAVAVLNTGDTSTLPELVHADIEWRDQMHAPDVPETIHGIAALKELAAQWEDAYRSLEAHVLEYVDADPWVICVTRWLAKTDGGMAVDVRSVDAYEVRDGKIARSWGGYPDMEAARAALGLDS